MPESVPPATQRPSQLRLERASLIVGIGLAAGCVLLLAYLTGIRWIRVLVLATPVAVHALWRLLAGAVLGAACAILGVLIGRTGKGLAVLVVSQMLCAVPFEYMYPLMPSSAYASFGMYAAFMALTLACAANRSRLDRPASEVARVLTLGASVLLVGVVAAVGLLWEEVLAVLNPSRAWPTRTGSPLWRLVGMGRGAGLMQSALVIMAIAAVVSLVNGFLRRGSRVLGRVVLVARHVALGLFALFLLVSVVPRLPPTGWFPIADDRVVWGLFLVGVLPCLYLSDLALADIVAQTSHARDARDPRTWIAPDADPAETPGAHEFLHVPGRTLEQRLENLYRMRDEGLLSDDAYQAERRRLTDHQRR